MVQAVVQDKSNTVMIFLNRFVSLVKGTYLLKIIKSSTQNFRAKASQLCNRKISLIKNGLRRKKQTLRQQRHIMREENMMFKVDKKKRFSDIVFIKKMEKEKRLI